jgi:ribosomal protein S18 acetylase RimI-like enzyme
LLSGKSGKAHGSPASFFQNSKLQSRLPMFARFLDTDVEEIVALINRAYRGIGDGAGWTSEDNYIIGDRITAITLRNEMEQKSKALFLKWVELPKLAPIGTVCLEPIDEETWYLGSLAIDPALQNVGLGKKLLYAAEEVIKERGGKNIRMSVVNVRDTLISWYERHGYTLTGETEPFPYSDNRFGVPTRDDLQFVILEKSIGGRNLPPSI